MVGSGDFKAVPTYHCFEVEWPKKKAFRVVL
jgi:hypothetical protein